MSHPVTSWISSIAMLSAMCPLALADDSVSLQSRVEAIVKHERQAGGTPAVAVAVIRKDDVSALVADGFADVEARIEATPQTVFQAASLTKLLTAVLVMHEVEAGRLSLDMPVNALLPTERQVRDTSGKPAPVTLRHLLSHSSGIPFRSAMQTDPDEPLRSLDEHLAHGLVTIRAPGEKLIYASDGFALAGWLAAEAAGRTFEQLAREVIFDPLHMTRSSLKAPRSYGAGLANAYEDSRRIPHASVSAGMPSGAWLTNIEDLARFAQLCLAGGEFDGTRVVSAMSMEQMMTLAARMHPRVPEGFGLGFGVRELPGRRLAWWDGQLPGAASRLALLPDLEIGVVVLANRADNDVVARISNRILDLLAPPPKFDQLMSSATDPNALVGRYRLTGMFARPRSVIERFANFKIENVNGKLELSTALSKYPSHATELGQGLLRIKTAGMDDAYAIVDGDRFFMSVVEGRRVSAWHGAAAWFVYSVMLALVLISALGWCGWRLVNGTSRSRVSTIRTDSA